jgi:hypothetical protein
MEVEYDGSALPCPFCGCSNIVVIADYDSYSCDRCYVEMSASSRDKGFDATVSDLLALWNTRAITKIG